jgi:hypothetical protein
MADSCSSEAGFTLALSGEEGSGAGSLSSSAPQIFGGFPGDGSGSSVSGSLVGAGKNTISRSLALPLPLNFCAREFQHSEQISYSRPSISFCRQFFGFAHKSQIITEHPLFPMGPGVTLLLVFLPCEGFDAKALRALFTDSDFRELAAHIANVACMFGPTGRVAWRKMYLHILPLVANSCGGLGPSGAVPFSHSTLVEKYATTSEYSPTVLWTLPGKGRALSSLSVPYCLRLTHCAAVPPEA